MRPIRIAILDLNAGYPNQGMRCIRSIIHEWSQRQQVTVACQEFEVRNAQEIPGTDFDLYLSSGGPGSPLESQGSEWENAYFRWIAGVEAWNATAAPGTQKQVFFICHSFQLACRYFGFAQVSKRNSTAFGIFPVHIVDEDLPEPVFSGLGNPFYAVDSRDYQVISPDHDTLAAGGGKVLAIEKERPHVPYERAVMAVRFNDHFIGTQFHPEADAIGMRMYLQRDDRKKTVVDNYGEAKWQSMIDQLNDPDKISWTNRHILPNFLSQATAALQPPIPV